MATTQKAIEIAKNLASELAKRSSLAVTQGSDASGNPTILVGAAAAGAQGAFIVVKPIDYPNSYNVIGQVATVYTPHVIQLCTEIGATTLANINTAATQLMFTAACAIRGTKLELYRSPNTEVPAAAEIIPSQLAAEFYSDIYFPMTSDQ